VAPQQGCAYATHRVGGKKIGRHERNCGGECFGSLFWGTPAVGRAQYRSQGHEGGWIFPKVPSGGACCPCALLGIQCRTRYRTLLPLYPTRFCIPGLSGWITVRWLFVLVAQLVANPLFSPCSPGLPPSHSSGWRSDLDSLPALVRRSSARS
jgi:hypothetical protein